VGAVFRVGRGLIFGIALSAKESQVMLSKGNKGALAELRVAMMLATTGTWTVFPNMLPNSDVDMVLLHNYRGYLLKCQVKSSYDGVGAAAAGNHKHLRQGRNDVLAIVTVDSVVFKVRNRKIQQLFPGSVLARPPKKKATKDAPKAATVNATRSKSFRS
jgi:paraquat-inducible protein B